MTSEILKGLTAIELCEVWAGPMAGSLLGDLGANVIKVESYPRNSPTRGLVDGGPGSVPGDGPPYERSGIHALPNRNKRHIAVNLRDEAGIEVVRRLIERADLFFDGYSAGTIEDLGFGWDVVHGINPRTVVVSMPGWGVKGPYRGYVTLGSGLDAASGHTAVRGYPDDAVENVKPIYHSDATGALTLLFAALTGLRQRERTGEGCYIDLSQIEAMVWQMPGLLGQWTLNQRLPERLGNTDPYVVPHDAYPTVVDDSWVFVAAENDAQWAGLARVLGHPEWAEDGHGWASVPGRLAARAEIDAAIAAFTSTMTGFDAADAIQDAGAVAAPIVNAPEMLASPQLLERGWIRTVDHRYSGSRLFPGFIWDIQPDPVTWDRPSGLVGEHNDEVLRELGYAAAETASLLQAGTIGAGYGPWDLRNATADG